MAKKYNFSIQFEKENFQIEGCDSFDEAIKIVEKAVYDRAIQLEKRRKEKEPVLPPPPHGITPSHVNQVSQDPVL